MKDLVAQGVPAKVSCSLVVVEDLGKVVSSSLDVVIPP